MTGHTNRRSYLKRAGTIATGISLTSFAGCVGSVTGGNAVKVGAFEPVSGNLAVYGKPKRKAYLLAAKLINEHGGINGRDVEVIFEDNQSETQRSQDIARRLIQQEEVDVLMGANTSATREAVRPIVDKQEQLYFYNNLYEGGLCDSYTFCTGLVPSQQLSALVPAMAENYGDKVYSLAPDYNFGHISDAWLKKAVEQEGGEVLNTEFIPLDTSQFGSTINRIQEADPDWIYSILVGQKQSAFYSQKASSGIDLPMASSFHLAESYEHRRFDPPTMQNMHVPINFMEELKQISDPAKEFVKLFRDEYPDTEYVNELAAHVWNGMWLYRNAAKQAGSVEQPEVINALESNEVTVATPDGVPSPEVPAEEITMYGPTHHLDHHVRLARTTEDHSIEWIGDMGIQRENWLQNGKGCNLTEEKDTSQYSP